MDTRPRGIWRGFFGDLGRRVETQVPAHPPAPEHALTPLQQAILQVLAGARRLLTRSELARMDSITRVRRDAAAMREAVNHLLKGGLIAEPGGKGQGIEITDPGTRCLKRCA